MSWFVAILGLWPFWIVAILGCGRFGCGHYGLWPFLDCGHFGCGRFGLWQFWLWPLWIVAVFGLWPFWLWPFWIVTILVVAVLVCGSFGCGHYGLWPFLDCDHFGCGRFGLWQFWLWPLWIVAVFGLWPFWLWPFWIVTILDCGRFDCGRLDLRPFVRYLNTNDNSLRSDLLHSFNLSTTTRGEDIFGQILDFFHLHELDFKKLVGCCSDGAASMMGVHKGFVARMKPISPNCKFIHCFLHRQALAAKKLSPILNELLSVCIKLVNFIKSRPLNNRIFSELCIDEEHKTLLLHTEVRWLSRGRVLGRLFELQNPVREFLKTMMLIIICGILKAVIVIF